QSVNHKSDPDKTHSQTVSKEVRSVLNLALHETEATRKDYRSLAESELKSAKFLVDTISLNVFAAILIYVIITRFRNFFQSFDDGMNAIMIGGGLSIIYFSLCGKIFNIYYYYACSRLWMNSSRKGELYLKIIIVLVTFLFQFTLYDLVKFVNSRYIITDSHEAEPGAAVSASPKRTG
ncbi:hypothetical protein, partial [Aurantimonas sp. VKM B-3413]|uniref:hypothetical protein n=1 Tax=Aurantimonas sp. VKM B-3413 TaxID=2779401 RepID=UPI001E5F5571